jgi:hypothetical protein
MDDELRMFDLPFDSAPFDWRMYWHRRHDRSIANRWIRQELRRVCSALVRPRLSARNRKARD